jgi:deazaflavin-dependent oxidoreductase (nitroreductase family)
MRADKHSGRQRIIRVVAVVLLGVGAAVVGVYWLLPRVARRNWDRVRRSDTMMRLSKWYNGARLKRAGSKRSATAILSHVGRRSGRTYETPLGACAYGDGFVLPLAYGSQTDWCRNVMAAGTCTLAWKGHTYELERPEIISGPEVMHTWPAWERIALRTAGIHEFLWLHHAKEQPGPAQQVDSLVEHRTP